MIGLGRNAILVGPISLFLLASNSMADEVDCGPPPAFTMAQKVDESLKGQLAGQADFLSKLVGKAELAGQVDAARTSIYQTSDQAFAAQKDAYLAYMFCKIVMQDKTLSTKDKLDAINQFRQPTPNMRRQQDPQRKAKIDELANDVIEASQIGDDFLKSNDTNAIRSRYDSWYHKVYNSLSTSYGPSYVSLFVSARGNGLMPSGHSIEGGAIYSQLQAKTEALNKLIDVVRNDRAVHFSKL
jgi:hypothetical protein